MGKRIQLTNVYRPAEGGLHPITQAHIDAALREPPKSIVQVLDEKLARDELKRRNALKAAQMRRYRARAKAKAK